MLNKTLDIWKGNKSMHYTSGVTERCGPSSSLFSCGLQVNKKSANNVKEKIARLLRRTQQKARALESLSCTQAWVCVCNAKFCRRLGAGLEKAWARTTRSIDWITATTAIPHVDILQPKYFWCFAQMLTYINYESLWFHLSVNMTTQE